MVKVMREADARTWVTEGEGIRCKLCPHFCYLESDQMGRCKGRRNDQGRMILLNYGRVCVSALDPIEKKPIFHFFPGSKVLSLGTFGCNLSCRNCQNAVLIKAGPSDLPFKEMTPEEVVQQATDDGAEGIAFTFNEPSIWFEFVLDVAEEAKGRGLFVVLNTNGYIQREMLQILLDQVQSMNIDVKAFNESFYRSNCSGHLQPVLESCLVAKREGVEVELTYLLIPGLNDSREELERFCDWVIKELGIDTPVHFFRFSPSYELQEIPEQSMEKMNEAFDIAFKKGIRFVYFGGVAGSDRQNTYCPSCGTLLVQRNSVKVSDKICFKGSEVSRFCPTFMPVKVMIDNEKCPLCGLTLPNFLIVNK